jgi:hypothetical protein
MEGIEMSNHLGDTNKMVRDTPRMDASAHDDGAIWETGCDIERELNAASVEIERLTAKVAQLYEGAEEAKQRIKRLEDWKESALEIEREWNANAVATLLGAKLGEPHRKVIQREVPKLLARIKRLEEGGDKAILNSYLPDRLVVWHKAKEAKL